MFGLALVCAAIWVPSANSQAASQTTASAQYPSPETGKQELLDLENHWLQVEDDPASLEPILAPDFLHVVGAGIITKDEQLNFMRKHPAPPSKQSKHFEDMHVRVYGMVGIVNGEVVAGEGVDSGRTLFTDVFAYRKGKWQAVSAQELPVSVEHHAAPQ